MRRINAAAEVGADLGLVFPRNDAEAATAPQLSRLPLVWVQSRGNRDGRPIYGLDRLKAMGYRACIDAQLLLGVAVHFMRQALDEMQRRGQYTGIGDHQFTAVRKDIEDLIGLGDYYQVEAETVEK
jgi:2-methylisocitrate lyase-like PEP mutase family enzyme